MLAPLPLLLIILGSNGADSWVVPTGIPPRTNCKAHGRSKNQGSNLGLASTSSWSIADDWSGLSRADSTDDTLLFGNLIHQVDSPDTEPTAEEQWHQETINAIMQVDAELDASESTTNDLSVSFEDDMGDEIALLVRCNEQPQSMLVQEGRAMAPLTQQEKYDPSQLVELFIEHWVPSKFLDKSVGAMFEMHAKLSSDPTTKIMDASCVAAWYQQSLHSKQSIGPHDQRVLSVLASYSTYGTGYLTMEDMKRLYLLAIVGDANECLTHQDISDRRSEALTAVWRDLENHGMLPPRETERIRLQQELLQKPQSQYASQSTVMDECELVYDKRADRKKKSSHELVVLASDNKTPLWINDGEFVFIDEDSCIGCTNCALAAPGSFEILDYDGRARTFAQRPKSTDIVAAVATCPVDCMHYVSFDELKELETSRDDGDGRQDHRHFGSSDARGYVERKPLHVQRRESDASHRSSWYHYLKDKCCKSPSCPERGCFDCPSYKNGSNPYFQERVRKATHIRAKQFMDTGVADSYRKTTDL